jgi:hypothetical protein
MKIALIFTDEELALIDSGKYTPGRTALDAKLDLAAALEREACAELVYNSPPSDEYESPLKAVYNAIRARGNT